MKKFVKISLITASIMLGIGIVIISICAFVSKSSLKHYVRDSIIIPESAHILHYLSEKDWDSADVVESNDGMIYLDSSFMHCVFNDNYPVYKGEHSDNEAASIQDVRNLCISIGGGELIVSESSDNQHIQLSSKGHDRFQYYTEDGTFYLSGFDDARTDIHDHFDNTIYLKIPAGTEFNDVTLDLGAGNMDFAFMNGDDIIVDVGAGKATFQSINANTIITDVGAGAIDLKNASIDDADFQIGLGSMSCTGLIRSSLDAECGMGSLNLQLNDRQKAHNYVLEGGMGNISIDGHNYGGIGFEKNLDNEAHSTYYLSCDMGSIRITFNE